MTTYGAPSSPTASETGEGGGAAAGVGEDFESPGFDFQQFLHQAQLQHHQLLTAPEGQQLPSSTVQLKQGEGNTTSKSCNDIVSFSNNGGSHLQPSPTPLLSSSLPHHPQGQQQQQQTRSMQSLPCTRCGYPNCDVQIAACQCLLHARCVPIPLRSCPNPRCFNSHPAFSSAIVAGSSGSNSGGAGCPLELLPMEFGDLDEARRVAELAAKASWRAKEKNRSRKKAKIEIVTNGGSTGSNGGTSSNVSATNSMDGQGQEEKKAENNVSETSGPPITPATTSELRTGRWTTEETAYCDLLIQKFITGRLPLSEGIKLNEFLSDMLKSKQSRLTKKMKNAKLSSKTFKRTSGYLADAAEAREFSEIEDAFFHSIQNGLERAEIKFHMQKEWREVFSTYCVSHGQQLNVDRWLASIEEMEKRVHHAKDAERMHRRRMMMGHALRQDLLNPDSGVVISNDNCFLDTIHSFGGANGGSGVGGSSMTQNSNNNVLSSSQQVFGLSDTNASSSTTATSGNGQISHSTSVSNASSSPYLHKILSYVQSHNIPFEYIDAWVPSFVPDSSDDQQSQSESSGGVGGGIDGKQESAISEKQSKCRLCFAGSIVANQEIVGDIILGHSSRAIPLSPDEHFNLSAFGEYSESFSFDVGCGLPGRVYHMGVPTWEQSVHNAPLHHFERVGGAQQWGIRTVVGIPIPSPNVGRIVVVLYSRHDRSKDHDLVIRLTEEFTRLMPSPRWKLVVDVGQPQMTLPMTQADVADHSTGDQLSIQQNQSGTMDPPQNYRATTATSPLCGDDPTMLISEVISIFGEHMPSDPAQPSFAFLQGFMSLRLLLLRSSRSEQEEDVVNTMLTSYASYKAGGRTRQDIALMLARDFMFMNLQAQPQMQLGQAHDPQMQSLPHFSASALSTSQMQQQQHMQQHQQGQNNFIYSPSNSSIGNPSNNNLNKNMLPPLPPSSQRQFHNQNQNQTHSISIQQQQPPLPPQSQHDSYTQGSNQQQQDYDNCTDSMLNELLSLPQDLMAAMTATATAAAALEGRNLL